MATKTKTKLKPKFSNLERMGSMAELKLPIVDFSSSGLEPGTVKWTATRDGVKRALESYGCFEARFKKVPVELQEPVWGSVLELFDLPLQTKLRNVSSKPFHGYVGQYPKVPLYESMGFEDADVYETVDGLTAPLCKTIQSYTEKPSELDQMIRRMILESLSIEKFLDEHMNSTNNLLRVMKYTGPKTTDDKIGLSPHTDKIFITILCQNEVHGLQVQAEDGEGLSAWPSPSSLVVMIGDPLHAWVNGRLHSPRHQVMMSGNEARYSAALFSIPKGGYITKAPDELVDEEHPLLFKPFDHMDHMEFLEYYYTESGQRAESALKTYCGV